MGFVNPIVVSRARFERLWSDIYITTDQIAADIGVHRSSVAGIAQRFGLDQRKSGVKPIKAPLEFRLMWLAGVSSREIAQHFCWSRNHTIVIARRESLPGRRQGEKAKMSLSEFHQAMMAAKMRHTAAIEQSHMISAGMVDVIAHVPVGHRHIRGAP
ncbi:MAG: hypothetical protein IPM06_21110 [Rhizobiales bacterium]|nr:hypothetical protein [Hyphomicrobiales bacterium]